ncbi:MAG: 16S rRNA (cytosine(967)-C(5))-methyltransferase RsmB [Lachnospiraceae bacterium]|nr:16S rRNA (cytosine(967)-C(5))-methyltransferase RsmB [Lachnospiraceae bacterium]
MEINTRELILDILLQIDRDGEPSHMAIGNTLEKYQFLPKTDRAFITRICEGTMEYRLQLDYIINCFSSVPIRKMKPLIREIMRFSAYQLKYMDSVPDSAVVNEAVKLAGKRGFRNLKGFVNGVLRSTARGLDQVTYPEDEIENLSVRYSMPEYLVRCWCRDYGKEACERMLTAFLETKATTIRLCVTGQNPQKTLKLLEQEGVRIRKAPYVDNAYRIEGYDYLGALESFRMGAFQVQDVSSMLVGCAAGLKEGDRVLDVCAAPGGKSLHAADLLQGTGQVISRDVSDYKVNLIRENVERLGLTNVQTEVKDAAIYASEDEAGYDVVLTDVPCSGYGVIGKKADIKYTASQEKEQELVKLQRQILSNAAGYVKPGGVLIYSTCTIGRKENQENVNWFIEHFSFEPESLDPYLVEELHSEETKKGCLQLLPGVHDCDGFFLARLRKQA